MQFFRAHAMQLLHCMRLCVATVLIHLQSFFSLNTLNMAVALKTLALLLLDEEDEENEVSGFVHGLQTGQNLVLITLCFMS